MLREMPTTSRMQYIQGCIGNISYIYLVAVAIVNLILSDKQRSKYINLKMLELSHFGCCDTLSYM